MVSGKGSEPIDREQWSFEPTVESRHDSTPPKYDESHGILYFLFDHLLGAINFLLTQFDNIFNLSGVFAFLRRHTETPLPEISSSCSIKTVASSISTPIEKARNSQTVRGGLKLLVLVRIDMVFHQFDKVLQSVGLWNPAQVDAIFKIDKGVTDIICCFDQKGKWMAVKGVLRALQSQFIGNFGKESRLCLKKSKFFIADFFSGLNRNRCFWVFGKGTKCRIAEAKATGTPSRSSVTIRKPLAFPSKRIRSCCVLL